MDVFRTSLIGWLSYLLMTSSPTAGEAPKCSALKVCGYFKSWSEAQVDPRQPRGVEVDLRDGRVKATQIREAITELALDELGADEILLTELVIKNGSIDGRLELDNLTVPFGLLFENVSIPTLKLHLMEFRKRLIFSNVRWHGQFYANRSEFQQSLEFTNGTGFEKRDRPVVLQIDKSTIEGDMRIHQTKFAGDVSLYGNEIRPALHVSESNFFDSIEIRDNEFGNLDIYEATIDKDMGLLLNDIGRLEIKNVRVFNGFQIEQNRIDDYVSIGSIYVNVTRPEAPVVLRNNAIREEFLFSANYLSPSVDRIELEGNTIRGRAIFEFPWLWFETQQSGIQINFQNSTFESLLRLGLHRPFADELYRKISSGAEEEESSKEWSYVYKASDQAESDSESGQDEDTYCYSPETEGAAPLLVVDFGNARIARLAWDLPTGDCRYQWQGSNFRYDRWTGSEDEQEKWIYQLAAPQPSTIYYVAEQLRAEGRFDRSRDLFLEAKRISYEPRSEGPYLTCSWDFWPWQADACVRQYMLYWYLTVSGFGVKPEFTILGLGATWAVGLFLFYVPYSWYARAHDPAASAVIPVPRWLDRLIVRMAERRGPRTRPLLGYDPGLAEDVEAFRQRRLFGRVDGGENRPPPGFALHQEQEPKRLSLSVFSLDATLPVINLHAYDSYYPESFGIQLVSYAQHVLGWILVSSLIASLAVL